jgi:hypothetical protein
MLRTKLCALSVAASVALAGFGVWNSFSVPTTLDPRLELIKLGDLSKESDLIKNELIKNELIKNELGGMLL